jgi:hypothetical protein
MKKPRQANGLMLATDGGPATSAGKALLVP